MAVGISVGRTTVSVGDAKVGDGGGSVGVGAGSGELQETKIKENKIDSTR